MPFTLEEVVPWGRTFEEYRRMFALEDDELEYSILGCGDGPASFNAELTRCGGRVLSCDPLYQFSAVQVQQQVRQTAFRVLREVQRNHQNFVWDEIASVRELGWLRLSAMRRFLDDYEYSHHRYIPAALPYLPFCNHQFDIALSSHFLFLYSQHLSLDFHLAALREMLRVAREVRVFPLLELSLEISKYLEPVTAQLRNEGFAVETRRVNYEFQKNGHTMLRILR